VELDSTEHVPSPLAGPVKRTGLWHLLNRSGHSVTPGA
jgi:hypothetical protein